MAGYLLFAMALGRKRFRAKGNGESLCVDFNCKILFEHFFFIFSVDSAFVFATN